MSRHKRDGPYLCSRDPKHKRVSTCAGELPPRSHHHPRSRSPEEWLPTIKPAPAAAHQGTQPADPAPGLDRPDRTLNHRHPHHPAPPRAHPAPPPLPTQPDHLRQRPWIDCARTRGPRKREGDQGEFVGDFDEEQGTDGVSGSRGGGGGAAGPGPCMPHPPGQGWGLWRQRRGIFLVHASLSSTHACFERQNKQDEALYPYVPASVPPNPQTHIPWRYACGSSGSRAGPPHLGNPPPVAEPPPQHPPADPPPNCPPPPKF